MDAYPICMCVRVWCCMCVSGGECVAQFVSMVLLCRDGGGESGGRERQTERQLLSNLNPLPP